jgi:hypothetical protein
MPPYYYERHNKPFNLIHDNPLRVEKDNRNSYSYFRRAITPSGKVSLPKNK